MPVAPSFSLPDQNGQKFDLDEAAKSGPVVLFFYPKDDSMMCTKQVCAFRDSYSELKDLGCSIVGISEDPVDSHARFSAKYKLPFPLLTDNSGSLAKLFGVKRRFGMIPGRTTFVIDQQKQIVGRYDAVLAADRHVQWASSLIRKSGS